MKKKQTSKKQSPITSKKVSKNTSTDSEYATSIVKVIAILGYIGSGFGILIGLLLLIVRPFILNMLPMIDVSQELPQAFASIASIALAIAAIFMIAFCVFWIFVSKALWEHKNWARIVFIIFAAIGVGNGVLTLPAGIVPLLIDGAIVYFLGFDDKVKTLFK